MNTLSVRSAQLLAALSCFLVLATVQTRGADAGTDQVEAVLQRLKAAPEAEVERASAEVDLLLANADLKKAGMLLDALGVAWYRHARYDEALQRFDQWVALQPKTAGVVFLKIAEIHRQRGDLKREVEALQASIRGPGLDTHRDIMDADNTSNIAYRRLGGIYENQGNWAKALASWERWSPTSWCGNEMAAYRHQRQMAIARCTAHLEDAKTALASLWKLVAEEDCLNGVHPEAAWSYAEIASRNGRIEEARRNFRRLPLDRRDRFLVSVAVWEGYRAGDAGAMIDALHRFDSGDLRSLEYGGPVEVRGAAGLLVELGAGARDILSRRIDSGDVHAVAVAGLTRDRDYLPNLRALEQREDMDRATSSVVAAAVRLLNEAETDARDR